MCIKAITQFWILILAYSATQQVNHHYDVFKLPYDVYFLSATTSTPHLQSDGCLRWQRRTWSTGVSQSEYRDAVKATASINWRCSTCDTPQSEITALSEISPDACLYILGTRAWTPGCLQKWPRHPPTHKATYGFTVPPCWKDWKKIPTTLAASNCQTLAGSAVTSMRIGSAARPSRHRPGACSWKPSGPLIN